MPNAKTHDRIGKASGGFVALLKANKDGLTSVELVLETIGGVMGGSLGAELPDVFDPPSVGPRHRGTFHGAAPAIRCLPVAFQVATATQTALRAHARRLLSEGAKNKDKLEGTIQAACGALLFIAAGAALGIPVGYTSHLIADAGSKEGLPLILGHDLPRIIKQLQG